MNGGGEVGELPCWRAWTCGSVREKCGGIHLWILSWTSRLLRLPYGAFTAFTAFTVFSVCWVSREADHQRRRPCILGQIASGGEL